MKQPQVKKKRGPTFAQIVGEGVTTLKYKVTREGLERPSSRTVYIDCPFCRAEVKAYVWSLCGGGKRCDCGALFGGWGNAYHFEGAGS